MVKQETMNKKKYFKRDFIDFQQFRGLKTKKINKNVMKWMFSHWPCYRSLARRIGPMDGCIGLRLRRGPIQPSSGQYD